MSFVVDTDSHAVEPWDLWTGRMASKWGDGIPHVMYVPERDCDMWFIGDQPVVPAGICAIGKGEDGGIRRREEGASGYITRFAEMHPSAWDPNERVKVMDEFGITAAVLYPNLGLIGPDIYRVLPDMPLEYQVGIAQAYNDWILSWAEQQPGRFVPLACLPYWDVPAAVKEIERCAEMGHHGFVSTGAPQWHGLPFLADRCWDPMWAAAQATGLPISFHVGGGGQSAERMEERIAVETYKSWLGRANAEEFLRNAMITGDLLMSGVLERFPRLRFIIVESGVGWIPFLLETLDWAYRQYDMRSDRPQFEPPSFYFHRQVFANSWFEKLDQWHADRIGAGNLLFETDYPHATCLIEDEVDYAIDLLADLEPADRDKILWKNATDLFQLDIQSPAKHSEQQR
jgi:predicted TIM-barrel fold metal-dependent hydrolase